jgi:hypothetical protein
VRGFSFYVALSAAVATGAAAVVALAPLTSSSRGAAWFGVALAAVSGAFALVTKRRAMSVQGLSALSSGMKAFASVMVLRVVVLGAGLAWVARHTDGAFPFVVGFFSVYLGQQWLEVSYLMSEQRRRSQPPGVPT